MIVVVFFFFKQKTAYEIKECDWSSDVCSSDLVEDGVCEGRFADVVVPMIDGQLAGDEGGL